MEVCDVCGKPCKTTNGLGAHKKKVHNVDPPCGTVGGYLKHRRKKEQADRECLAAWARNARTKGRK